MAKWNCLRCSEQMQFYTHERIQLGKTGWVLGDLPNLFAGALEVDVYICPNCKKLEFYAAEELPAGNTLPQKTCPVCGTVHDFDYPQCPKCKFDYFGK